MLDARALDRLSPRSIRSLYLQTLVNLLHLLAELALPDLVLVRLHSVMQQV